MGFGDDSPRSSTNDLPAAPFQGVATGAVSPKGTAAEELKPLIQTTTQFEDLASLLAMFDNTQQIFKDMETFRRIAHEAVLDAHEEGIVCLELRYA